ncbi:MAG: hypothetical protein A3F78_19985 [Burkholderiales bacterium RIFCSPLOWO2_12_FULL_61_40]|nr:MAG: hypothetical protein A3F78_19985 [Burkholderiales bacterium RIFCSPLOWO2_12_FULL_61_40]
MGSVSFALVDRALGKSPYKARMHNNLGYVATLAKRNDDARREIMIALQIDPNHFKCDTTWIG